MNGTLYYYHYNAHGDVIRLTDWFGNTVAEYEYDAWGNITNAGQLTAIAKENPYRYAGYWYDSETNLYYLKARYYKPDLGRFISQDAWKGSAWQPRTHNQYSYAMNNPITMVDPTGNIPISSRVIAGVKGVLKIVSGIGELGVAAASFTAAAGTSVTVVGAIGFSALGVFALSDGIMNITDGVGDLVEAFSGKEVPTLNGYAILAEKVGGTGGSFAYAAVQMAVSFPSGMLALSTAKPWTLVSTAVDFISYNTWWVADPADPKHCRGFGNCGAWQKEKQATTPEWAREKRGIRPE